MTAVRVRSCAACARAVPASAGRVWCQHKRKAMDIAAVCQRYRKKEMKKEGA
jgi:hypothetical protein